MSNGHLGLESRATRIVKARLVKLVIDKAQIIKLVKVLNNSKSLFGLVHYVLANAR
jgi:hypothetical protein